MLLCDSNMDYCDEYILAILVILMSELVHSARIQELQFSIHYARSNLTACDWAWDSRRNQWDGWLLWYVASGQGTIIYPGQGGATYRVEPGSCCLFNMHEHFEGVATTALAIHALGFLCTTSSQVDQHDLWLGQRRHRRMRQGRLLQDCIDTAIEARNRDDQSASNQWLRSALLLVAGEDAQPQLSGPQRQRADAVASLATRMQEDPARAWSSADVTTALELSREQAVRIFKRYQGFAPGDWVVRCRIERAKQLLRFSTGTVREVALAVGYEDPYYFSRLFKKHCDLSPKHWRLQPWEEDVGNISLQSAALNPTALKPAAHKPAALNKLIKPT